MRENKTMNTQAIDSIQPRNIFRVQPVNFYEAGAKNPRRAQDDSGFFNQLNASGYNLNRPSHENTAVSKRLDLFA